MAKKKAARKVDTLLPPSSGKLKKLPLRGRVALGLRLAELALAPMSVGFRKRYRVEESFALARKIVEGKRYSERDRKTIAEPPDRWFNVYGESVWRGETYSFYEVTCATNILYELQDKCGRAVSCVIDGAAFLVARQWQAHWGIDSSDLTTEQNDALGEEVYRAAWRAYEIVCAVNEQELSLSTLTQIEFAAPQRPVILSRRERRDLKGPLR